MTQPLTIFQIIPLLLTWLFMKEVSLHYPGSQTLCLRSPAKASHFISSFRTIRLRRAEAIFDTFFYRLLQQNKITELRIFL